MINAYDILVNYKKIAYDFYEWDKEDKIKHIKKIPCFRVDEKTLLDFFNYNIDVNKDFLKEIENKTEIFNIKGFSIIRYSCILYCNLECICILFDNCGHVIARSKLLFDEVDDIISSGKKQNCINIDYKVISKLNKKDNYTRKENNNITFLTNYISELYKNKRNDELNYLYFECFKSDGCDIKDSFLKLRENIHIGNFFVIEKLNSLIKVIKR